MKVDVLLGLQWGDEGKGKVVDVLTPKYDVVTRFQGGPNAGHTLESLPGYFRVGKRILSGMELYWIRFCFVRRLRAWLPVDMI